MYTLQSIITEGVGLSSDSRLVAAIFAGVAYAIWSAFFKQNLQAGPLTTFRFGLTLWIVPTRPCVFNRVARIIINADHSAM